jgi:hypothetical protein
MTFAVPGAGGLFIHAMIGGMVALPPSLTISRITNGRARRRVTLPVGQPPFV